MTAKKYLATITILVKDRQVHAKDMNQLLTYNGSLILSRLGVNVERIGIKNYTGLIVVVVEGEKIELDILVKKIDELYGIVAKINIME